MARGRIMLGRNRSGVFFDTSVTAEGAAFNLLSMSKQSKIRKAGVAAAAKWFVDARLPLRFTELVRRAPFNYRGGKTDRHRDPLFTTGNLKKMALAIARRFKVIGGRSGAKARIKVGMTEYSSERDHIQKVLATVTQKEADWIGDTVVQTMIAMINGQPPRRNRRR